MRVLSLFSGIGGLDLAAEWAGMTTVAFCERDKYCQKVLAKHWPGVPVFDDVTTLKGDQVGTVDVISGGYPCQSFSQSGRRLGEQDDRHLWPEYFRLIQECRPSWVVGENVIGHIDMGLDNVLTDLESIGYATRPFDIPACAIGADHQRRRIFIVAHAERGRQQKSRRCVNEKRKAPDFDRETTGAIRLLSRESMPYVCGKHDGISSGMDRLRALGNAVVPQQAYPIFKAIAEVSA